MVQTIPGDPRPHMILTECTMTADIDIDLNKAMMNHKDTLIIEATQLTQLANLLDKPPDTDIPIRPSSTDISNRPINILIPNNPLDTSRPPDRNISKRPPDIDTPNTHITIPQLVGFTFQEVAQIMGVNKHIYCKHLA